MSFVICAKCGLYHVPINNRSVCCDSITISLIDLSFKEKGKTIRFRKIKNSTFAYFESEHSLNDFSSICKKCNCISVFPFVFVPNCTYCGSRGFPLNRYLKKHNSIQNKIIVKQGSSFFLVDKIEKENIVEYVSSKIQHSVLDHVLSITGGRD